MQTANVQLPTIVQSAFQGSTVLVISVYLIVRKNVRPVYRDRSVQNVLLANTVFSVSLTVKAFVMMEPVTKI